MNKWLILWLISYSGPYNLSVVVTVTDKLAMHFPYVFASKSTHLCQLYIPLFSTPVPALIAFLCQYFVSIWYMHA